MWQNWTFGFIDHSKAEQLGVVFLLDTATPGKLSRPLLTGKRPFGGMKKIPKLDGRFATTAKNFLFTGLEARLTVFAIILII